MPAAAAPGAALASGRGAGASLIRSTSSLLQRSAQACSWIHLSTKPPSAIARPGLDVHHLEHAGSRRTRRSAGQRPQCRRKLRQVDQLALQRHTAQACGAPAAALPTSSCSWIHLSTKPHSARSRAQGSTSTTSSTPAADAPRATLAGRRGAGIARSTSCSGAGAGLQRAGGRIDHFGLQLDPPFDKTAQRAIARPGLDVDHLEHAGS